MLWRIERVDPRILEIPRNPRVRRKNRRNEGGERPVVLREEVASTASDNILGVDIVVVLHGFEAVPFSNISDFSQNN
jgi:hypothetical protein